MSVTKKMQIFTLPVSLIFRVSVIEIEINCVCVYSTQVIASWWPKRTQVERESKTCVHLCRLASSFGQDFKLLVILANNFPHFSMSTVCALFIQISFLYRQSVCSNFWNACIVSFVLTVPQITIMYGLLIRTIKAWRNWENVNEKRLLQ